MPVLTTTAPALGDEFEFADRVIAAQGARPGALLSVLERVQERSPHKYLCESILEYIAQRMDLPLAQVYSVATFYSLFNLQPQGRHTVCVCRGTACHTRGSRNLMERLKLELGVREPEEDGEGAMTTPDGEFTVRTVACFGQCALAPVVEVDHAIHGHVNEQTLQREVANLSRAKGGRG